MKVKPPKIIVRIGRKRLALTPAEYLALHGGKQTLKPQPDIKKKLPSWHANPDGSFSWR